MRGGRRRFTERAYGEPAARLGIKTDGVSQMAFPLPGEKLFTQDEEDLVYATKKADEVAERIFGPLLKK